MTRPHINVDNPRFHLFSIVLITFVFYVGTCNNFFYADDFIWLNRVKHLAGNWSNMFTVENRYFTPLTYLSFYVSHKLFGLNPFWYHLHDVIIHSLNGCLLYLLTGRITGKRLTALLAALLFVTSSAILITVLWPSARTDLFMVFFSLATMVTFTGENSAKYSLLSLALYVLALCAKGTALVVPVVLFLLTVNTKQLKERLFKVAPYFAIAAVYTALLMLYNSLGAKFIEPSHKIVSLTNFVKSLPALIVPERYLAGVVTPVLVLLCIAILVMMLVIFSRSSEVAAKIGAALTVLGLLPILFTRDYALAGNKANAIELLSSPSNRVYLACSGIALLYAVLLERLMNNRRLPAKLLSGSLLFLLLGCNYYEIKKVGTIWHNGTEGVKKNLAMLERNRGVLTRNSILLLYNFEGSSGFSTAILQTYFDLQNIEVHACDYRYTEELTNFDLSPLNNPEYANIKLILGCPENPSVDALVLSGNLLVQEILADYRRLSAPSDVTVMQPTRKRLEHNLTELRTILNNCGPTAFP